MYTDKNLKVSTDQAITTGDIKSTDVIDLSIARDIGEGEDLYAYVNVTETFLGGTSLTVQVVVASDSTLSSNVQRINQSDAVPLVALVAPTGQKQGYVYALKIDPVIAGITAATASQENRGARYLGLIYSVAGTFTAGKVSAEFVHGIQDGRKAYSSGFTVV